jgi:hypothetical protein
MNKMNNGYGFIKQYDMSVEGAISIPSIVAGCRWSPGVNHPTLVDGSRPQVA